MKYDLNSKPNKAAKRTLAAFSATLLSLLENNSLEKITVNMLCGACDYPRATFYNYFDDIYDLLYYCFCVIRGDLDMDKFIEVEEGKRTLFLFGIFYDYLKSQEKWLKNVLEHNPAGGEFVARLRKYIKEQISLFMEQSAGSDIFPVSRDILVEHYANTIELVVNHCFMPGEPVSKAEAFKTLDYLLGTIEQRARNSIRA